MKITRRQLRRIIREVTIGVKDASKTAKAFADGDVGDEMFLDIDDKILNVSQDPGVVKNIEVIPETVQRGGAKLTPNYLKQLINEVLLLRISEQVDITSDDDELVDMDMDVDMDVDADAPVAQVEDSDAVYEQLALGLEDDDLIEYTTKLFQVLFQAFNVVPVAVLSMLAGNAANLLVQHFRTLTPQNMLKLLVLLPSMLAENELVQELNDAFETSGGLEQPVNGIQAVVDVLIDKSTDVMQNAGTGDWYLDNTPWLDKLESLISSD